MRECLLSAAMVLLVTPAVWAGSTTAFRLGEGGGVIVAVTLDGHGPFAMLLDTGATHSAITQEVADRIGARVVAQSNVVSPISGVMRPIVAVERLALGPITVDLLLPSVVANDAFDKKRLIHGLIGQDVLAGLRYTIDFRRHLIEWHDGPPLHDGARLPLVFDHGRYLVSVPLASRMLRLVPDSGAGGLVLFETKTVTALLGAELGGTVQLVTADATRRARTIRLPELRLGARILRNVPAVAIDHTSRHTSEGDGLLPLHLFERVTFDGPSRVLILGG